MQAYLPIPLRITKPVLVYRFNAEISSGRISPLSAEWADKALPCPNIGCHTACPRSLDSFYLVTYYIVPTIIEQVKISWTDTDNTLMLFHYHSKLAVLFYTYIFTVFLPPKNPYIGVDGQRKTVELILRLISSEVSKILNYFGEENVRFLLTRSVRATLI